MVCLEIRAPQTPRAGDTPAGEAPPPEAEPETAPPPAPSRPIYVASVSYGAMGVREKFATEIQDITVGTLVVLRTSRGTELGKSLMSPAAAKDESARHRMGRILRIASNDDQERARRIARDRQPSESEFCSQKIKEHGLPMKLAVVENLFGGE